MALWIWSRADVTVVWVCSLSVLRLFNIWGLSICEYMEDSVSILGVQNNVHTTSPNQFFGIWIVFRLISESLESNKLTEKWFFLIGSKPHLEITKISTDASQSEPHTHTVKIRTVQLFGSKLCESFFMPEAKTWILSPLESFLRSVEMYNSSF